MANLSLKGRFLVFMLPKIKLVQFLNPLCKGLIHILICHPPSPVSSQAAGKVHTCFAAQALEGPAWEQVHRPPQKTKQREPCSRQDVPHPY